MNSKDRRDDNTRERLQKVAQLIDEELPDGWGFALFAFPFNNPEGRLNYVAKGKREDVVPVVKGWIDKTTNENFGKHL